MLSPTTFLRFGQTRYVARGGDVVFPEASRPASQPYHGGGFEVRLKFLGHKDPVIDAQEIALAVLSAASLILRFVDVAFTR